MVMNVFLKLRGYREFISACLCDRRYPVRRVYKGHDISGLQICKLPNLVLRQSPRRRATKFVVNWRHIEGLNIHGTWRRPVAFL